MHSNLLSLTVLFYYDIEIIVRKLLNIWEKIGKFIDLSYVKKLKT